MKAIELRAFGVANLRVVSRPDPTPGTEDLLLRISAASLNYRDVEILEGRYAMPVPLPVIPLSDAVGEVVAVGENVRDFVVGDRVCPTFFPDWVDGPFDDRFFARQLGSSVDGALRELMVVPSSAVVRAPSHLGHEAATLAIAGVTAWSALSDARIGPGQRVLIMGTGGVSLFALQLARVFGAEVGIIANGESAAERAKKLGADWAIDRSCYPDWGVRVREMSAGFGVDLIVDVAGATTAAQLPAALRTGGTVAIVGYASGAQLNFDLRPVFIGRRARLHGHTVGSRREFDLMSRTLEQHRIIPAVDSRYDFEDVEAAYARLKSGKAFGKVLVTL
jgi:NADPH:quinone reductase-like Zn-dependent oxidoreductase